MLMHIRTQNSFHILRQYGNLLRFHDIMHNFCFIFQKNATYFTILFPVQITLMFFMYHSFIPLACAECDDSLPFSGASSIPLCYVLLPATLLHQLFFHPPSPHLAIYFFVYLSALLFPNSYIIPFWKFYFLPFSVHAQTNVIYLTLLSLFFDILLTVHLGIFISVINQLDAQLHYTASCIITPIGGRLVHRII